MNITCPKCAQEYEIEDDMIGVEVECEKCAAAFVITKPVETAIPSASPPKRRVPAAGVPPNRSNAVRRASVASASTPSTSKATVTKKPRRTGLIVACTLVFIGLAAGIAIWVTQANRKPTVTQAQSGTTQSVTSPVKSTAPQSTQAASLQVSEWERQNRDIIIKMVTDGHVYFSDNQQTKALATYGMLFDLIGGNEIQDVTLRKLVDQAKTERVQIGRIKQETERQIGMLLRGTVTIAKKNGDIVYPQIKVALAPAESEEATKMKTLWENVKECSVCEAKERDARENVDHLERFPRSQIDAITANAMKALTDSRDARIKIINTEMDASLVSIFMQQSAIPVVATDTKGQFVFSDTKPGKYVIMAKAIIGAQHAYWIMAVNKDDSALAVTMNNDNAQVIRDE